MKSQKRHSVDALRLFLGVVAVAFLAPLAAFSQSAEQDDDFYIFAPVVFDDSDFQQRVSPVPPTATATPQLRFTATIPPFPSGTVRSDPNPTPDFPTRPPFPTGLDTSTPPPGPTPPPPTIPILGGSN